MTFSSTPILTIGNTSAKALSVISTAVLIASSSLSSFDIAIFSIRPVMLSNFKCDKTLEIC